MKIAFYQPHLDIQGTGVCYYDYALYNEKILGNKSVMIYDKKDHRNHPLAEKKFKENIEVIGIDGNEDMNMLLKEFNNLNADALYIQKCGRRNDGRFVDGIPSFIHVVGVNNDPHGTVYAYVSEWLAQECSQGSLPFVPYIVNLPNVTDGVRDKLNIPEEAIVFGRHGGDGTFNIPFVYSSIQNILKKRDDVYFVFLNTNQFLPAHPRIIHLAPVANLKEKRMFINSCDAMIHARPEGESFGAAVAEFSICNKPVITYYGSRERNHIFTLKDKGIYYNNAEELENILLNFKKEPDKDWNAYREFSPENVMLKFKKVFIDTL